MPKLTGAQHLVRTLIDNGVRLAFGVPGESYLAVLDALVDVRDDLRFITTRHEAGAANMAEAYGKLTGRPGIAMVTRGPGAAHAAVGVHTAFQDSTPMILLIGQVARAMKDREGFQEVDYTRFYGDQVKWAAEIADPARVPEYMARAFAVAMNGRPGPVALALPEDMLAETAKAEPVGWIERALAAPAPAAIKDLKQRLERAERPLVLLGGGGWTPEAVRDAERFIEANDLPVACTFRAKDYYPNDGPNYAGDLGIAPNPVLAARVREADLILAIGPRLGEITTSGYTLLTPPRPDQDLIHIHPGAEELGRVYIPDLAINASIPEACAALRRITVDASAWAGAAAKARKAYEGFSTPIEAPAGVNLSKVFAHLAEALPKSAIVTNGAGNYAGWLHRFYKHRAYRTQLAPTSGAMGYGVPAAIAAKLLHPERIVVSVSGDGCFLMSVQELATAAQYGLRIIFLVVDNGSYGTIRMHQARDYPGRVSGTDLVNPDFLQLGRAFGCYAKRVDDAEDFPAALRGARRARGPALIVIKGDVEAIAPGVRLSALGRG